MTAISTTLRLSDLAGRARPPRPWSEGDNIPWNDPAFSARMLREHLTDAHDAASRRATIIERHVAWIHRALLEQRPSRILDLGCGPGLYTSRLARLGHTCEGVDWSPASIAYARAEAAAAGLACRYQQADLRTADYGAGADLAMLIFGELNVFARADAERILRRAHAALCDSGLLLLEPHTIAAVRAIGAQPPGWHTAERGLWSDEPYLCLEEHFWDEATATATTRFFVVDLGTGAVSRYAQSFQAYTSAHYAILLAEQGFDLLREYPALGGHADAVHDPFTCLVARKRPG